MAPFRLYVTHVDGEGPFLRISGQLDQQSSLMVESLFEAARDNLENGVGTVPPAAIHEGVICAAKYKDGIYYRAKIINTTNLATGLVGVHFIDFGNKDIISLSTIRFLDSYDPMFLQLRGQANDYYLSRVVSPLGIWEEPLLLKLQSLLCYAEYAATIEAHTRSLPLISIQFKGNDLSTHLVSVRIGVALPLAKQEVLVLQMSNENQQTGNWQVNNEPSAYTEHVPFLINQNFPSNPASAMRLQQNVSIPFNGNVPPPSIISQRLLVNKASRNTVNLKPVRQPQHANQPAATVTPSPTQVNKAAPTSPPSNKLGSPKKSTTYKSRLLETNSQHKVFVSFADEGPELFAVQLVTDAKKLQDMMDDINRRPHRSLTEPPMIGTVCLGRMSGDRIICRAIVMNLSGSQCKLFFVDFGDTEMVSYYDIFDIPEEFVKPNVFAMRFCLSKVKELEKGPHLNETFKHLVNGKVLTLKVVPPEGPPLIQYGELYSENRNILDILMANMKDKLQFKWLEMLPLGAKQSVLVSYVDSCIKFYVQISDKIDELKVVMEAVKVHCENSSAPKELPVGAACCARFPDDDAWYRARIRDVKENKVIVAYVDYGNEQQVNMSDLRTITPELMRLPAQAMKCALKGFENKPLETKTSNQLEMLALEKTLMAHIVGVLSNDTMLVTLVDDTVNPPMDIARRMNQLSQPRSSHETKVTTPVRKDAPESFSSPEGSVPDDGRKKSFRREKSFKEERRPTREPTEELPQRGGSFRSRDNKEGFDRSGPGRYSDKFGGRPERPERRGGSKPWENNGPTPAATSPEEIPSESRSDHSASSKPQYGRRKPRSDQQERGANKPTWRKADTGVGKRLRQAAEAAFTDTTSATTSATAPTLAPSTRHRRDKFNHREDREERNGDDRWNRGREGRDNRDTRDTRDSRDNRPERRERRDNWNDKKDNNYQRQDRPRSNFTPRDRAERSFGSDNDKGYRPRDARPPCRQLADPVPLTYTYTEPTVEPGSQHEVSVTWIVSPENFYCQILSEQPSFLDMMHRIPELYKGVKSYTGPVEVGASVLARYPVDGVLYRATIVAIQPFSKYIVRYVDFGNKQLVDAKDLWQLERQLMELPKMAVHCSLVGVVPKDGEWKADPEIDLCFNAPRYQCVFQDCSEEQYKVSLWNNSISVADILVEKQLAALSEHQSSVTLKDEAIDLMIIVGQQIPCRVTHVESYDKFYVQLDLEKATLVETAIANFDSTKLTPLSADSLMEGIHCTVKHEDKIYRAILEDTSDTSNIIASLPDYGNEITTKLENLMILPTELSVYYYQALKCCLNNYSSESKTLVKVDELKQKLTGNKFIIYINSVEEICLVTTLYDIQTGQKVPLFEPDEGAYNEVVQLCTRSVFNYNFGLAYVSHAENLNEIYMQKASDGDKIAQILEELYNFYEEGTPEPLTTFEVDGLCAVKSSDSNWYRATILSVNDNDVKVQFPDYGNSETVSKDSLKKLDSKFYEPCALGLVAGLGLVALQDDALSKLLEWTNEKEIQVTLAFGSDGWLASLHIDGVDLSIKLVNEKLATPRVDSQEEPKVETLPPEEEPISLPEGCTQFYISHIDSPGLFWLQMLDKTAKIEEIQASLQANFGSYKDIEGRELGTLCVAKYSADGQWYRAEILDSDSDITTIRFIDYGNTDVLDNEPGLIKEMPENLKEIERFALKSSVNAIPTGTGQWSEPASDYFTELVGDLSSPVDARIVLKDTLTYVDIYVNGQNLTDKLVSEGHATRSEEPECGDLPSCFASHVNSPSEFWIQLENATPDLQAMEAAMVDAENFPELTDKEEGVICAAKYPEDGEWYRAQVIVDGSEGTEVLFMDYGNASIANELRNLPDELKLKPALSRKCALQKPRDIKSWSRKSEVKFNELAAEGATIFNVQFIAAGDISIVELYLEGKSVTEELLGLCDDTPPPERPTPVGQDLLCNGKLCYVNSVDEFYVQLNDSVSNLDKVIEKLGHAEDFDEVVDLKVGSLCAAFWSEDEQWYRAKVLEFCDVGYHVQFVDYGNKAKCEEFRQLPEDIVLIEPLAKCCRLAGLPNDTNLHESGRNKLDDYAAEDVTFQIEFLDSTKEPVLVKMLIDGKDVTYTFVAETTNATSENTEEHKETDIDVLNSSNSATKVEETPVTSEIHSNDKPDNNLTSNNPEEYPKTKQAKQTTECTDEKEPKDTTELNEDKEASELNNSLPDLDNSFSSTHTVIENKSFEDKADSLSEDILQNENVEVETSTTHDKTAPLDASTKSEESITTPDSDESKSNDSTSDTGYASAAEQKSPEKDKTSINKETSESLSENELAKKLESPTKGTDSNAAGDSKNEDKIKDLVAEESISKNEVTVETSESEKK